MKTFARLSTEERAVFVEQAATQLGLPAGSVEKDFWVCWTLRALFELPEWAPSLTFKGGTSLSKGFRFIRRFSEDLDVVIDRERLGFGGANSPDQAPSLKQRRIRLDRLREACQVAVERDILPALRAAAAIELGAAWADRVALADADEDADRQTVLVQYPSAFARALLYVRPVVKIEFGARSDTEPSETPRITPYVAEVLPTSMTDRDFAVKVVAARRTFLEKVCLLHEETFRPVEKPRKARMARHYYDVWSLIRAGVGAEALADEGLFERVAEHRPVFFKQTWVDYSQLRRGSIRILPPEEQRAAWAKDYNDMRQEMFWEDVPTFDDLLSDIATFEAEMNASK